MQIRLSIVLPLAFAASNGVASFASAATETVIYSFKGKADGALPWAGLTNLDGTLFGTTLSGGHFDLGTVFSVTTAGVEKVLRRLDGTHDGASPDYGSLTNVAGTLYGTTNYGGPYGGGTVFSMTPAGVFTTLHNFGGFANGVTDGASPLGGVVVSGKTLYGTTGGGGALGNGTVYSLTLKGNVEATLVDLVDPADGFYPAAITWFGNAGYATATNGGANGGGTLFSVTRSGSHQLLHSFGGAGDDGSFPIGSLIKLKGAFYGTTANGGTYGAGSAYSITKSGSTKTIYSFGAQQGDATAPSGTLLNVDGTFYGTSSQGGTNGKGTVFSLTPSGVETVLYSFKGGKDGDEPEAGLILVDGKFYGTTLNGGTHGHGTVFSIQP